MIRCCAQATSHSTSPSVRVYPTHGQEAALDDLFCVGHNIVFIFSHMSLSTCKHTGICLATGNPDYRLPLQWPRPYYGVLPLCPLLASGSQGTAFWVMEDWWRLQHGPLLLQSIWQAPRLSQPSSLCRKHNQQLYSISDKTQPRSKEKEKRKAKLLGWRDGYVVALPEDVSFIHMVAHNCLNLQFQRIWCPHLASASNRHANGLQTYIQTKYSHTYKIN